MHRSDTLERIGLGASFPNFECRTTHGLLEGNGNVLRERERETLLFLNKYDKH